MNPKRIIPYNHRINRWNHATILLAVLAFGSCLTGAFNSFGDWLSVREPSLRMTAFYLISAAIALLTASYYRQRRLELLDYYHLKFAPGQTSVLVVFVICLTTDLFVFSPLASLCYISYLVLLLLSAVAHWNFRVSLEEFAKTSEDSIEGGEL